MRAAKKKAPRLIANPADGRLTHHVMRQA